MPNSFTVFPNVLPGNVTIGGNLTVGGDQVRIGAAAPFTRVGKASAGQGFISSNLGFDEGTRDDGTKPAFDWNLDTVGGTPTFQRANAAGTVRNEALANAIFTDYTAHAHTGTTTVDTIYTKLIPANTLGLNGGILLQLFFQSNSQGATNATITVNIGATPVATFTFNATGPYLMLVWIGNRNSASAQIIYQDVRQLVAGTSKGTTFAGAANTAVDNNLTVTVQNGATTDSQTFDLVAAQQMNSFGPV